jgi:hypothetical protein
MAMTHFAGNLTACAIGRGRKACRSQTFMSV